MTETSAPPPPPTQNNSAIWAVLAVVVLGGAGFWVWKSSNGDAKTESTPVATTAAEVTATETPAAPPPPPPPPPPLEPEVSAPAPAQTGVRAGKGTDTPGPAVPAACAGPCDGTIDSAFRSALGQMGASARGCYDRALRNNSALAGKMTVAVRVSPSGSACSVSAAADTLGDPSVTSCILQKFRSGKYPRPKGACVDAAVPLNFVSQK